VSQLEQVLGGAHGAGEVVRVDRRQARRPLVRVDGHHGHGRLHVDHRRGDQHRAVDQRAGQPGQVAALPARTLVVAASGVGEQLVAGVPERLGGTLEDLGAERLELGDQDADHVRLVGAQAARHQARLVAEVGDHVAHALRRRARDAVPVVEHLGDGGDRHAGGPCHVGDGHPVCHADQSIATKTLSITFDSPVGRVSKSLLRPPLEDDEESTR